MPQSKLVSVTPKIDANGNTESFTGQYGTLYKHVVVFADGTTGTANSKTPIATWKVGSEYTYKYTPDNYGGKISGLELVKDVPPSTQSQQQGNSNKSPEENKRINLQVAYEVSTNIIVKSAEGLDPQQYPEQLIKQIIENNATDFNNWIMEVPHDTPCRCNALRRALDQMDIPQLGINSKTKVLERAKEIYNFYHKG